MNFFLYFRLTQRTHTHIHLALLPERAATYFSLNSNVYDLRGPFIAADAKFYVQDHEAKSLRRGEVTRKIFVPGGVKYS